MKKKAPNYKAFEAKKILRKANQEEIDLWVDARKTETTVMSKARKLAETLRLDMKISDVEFQGDKTKATFYYTAENRIDFRQLIKDMADSFKVRIEMRQIGARQEAARLGGIGSCGRELCCSTWLTDFRSVSTSAARYQQLSLNPQKLAGQCGKLKCCLNYELDMYLEAIKSFPSADTKIKTAKGKAYHVKTDVFKRMMWFAYENTEEPGTQGLFALTPERVKEILHENKAGKVPEELVSIVEEPVKKDPDFSNVVGQDSLNRFDDAFKRKKKKKKKNKGGENNQRVQNEVTKAQSQVAVSAPQQQKIQPAPQQKKKKPHKKPVIELKKGDNTQSTNE